MKRILLVIAVLCLAALVSLVMRPDRRVQSSASSTMNFSGQIQGGSTAEYTLTSTRGQRLRVTLQSRSPDVHFSLFAPGKGPGDTAMFSGATSGDRFSDVLPESGTYTVQVYLDRSAAGRGDGAAFMLKLAVTPN